MASNQHFAHMCHLRRILPQKNGEPGGPSSQIASLILLDTYVKFGRNHDLCDVVLTSTFSSSNMISRDHAEINAVKAASGRIEKYMITDHSLNGTYINDRRCQNNVPTQINEGDIIKFGHMNGASIKGGQVAPQANAEFAFVVERANPAYSYLGFRDGRRARPLVCRGEMEVCQETELTRKNTMPQQNQMAQQPMPQTTVSQAAQAANQANQNAMNQFLQGIPPQLAAQLYSYQLPNIFAQQAAAAAWNLPQVSGFRAPNVSNLLASSIAAGMPPSTSASLLSRGLLPGMVNPLLTPVTAAAAMAAVTSAGVHPTQDSLISATMASTSPAVMTHTQTRPEDIKEEVKMRPVQKNDVASGCEKISHVASPPMECDSSVPSPPKQPPKKEMISPKPKEEERSDADSPPMRRGANTAPTPWDSSPSPRQHTPDRESVKEESEKEMTTTTTKRTPAPVVKHRKTNEIARLLDDITEGSFANQMRRASTSRRPTDDEMCEKNAKKEKKKFQKEKEKAKKDDNRKTVSTVGRPPARRMKQLSDESSASSDSDSDVPSSPVKREPPKRKREPSISSAESASNDSEDSSKPKKKHKTKGRPRKTEKKENRGRKPKVQPKPAYSSEEDEEELDPDSELVTTHDPASVCGLSSQCTQPQSQHVNWVCCDDCDKWYHTICILGMEKEINEPEFHCGCKKQLKNKKKGRK